MTTRAPALLPLLRSENQLRVLAALLLAPGESFTVTELAARTGVPQPSVSREVAALLAAGVVVATEERGRRVFAADVESTIYPELSSLLRKTIGPKAVLESRLAGVDGIAQAFLYGSWARRYAGVPGPEPRDVDLLVVVEAADVGAIAAIRTIADEASAELGRDVNATVLTSAEWRAKATGFLRQVKSSPRVELDLDGG